MESTKTSSSALPGPKLSDLQDYSQKDLHSIQVYLDRDFQNFWDVRRFGGRFGLVIKCGVCGAVPPVQREQGEETVWYNYRKWRWLANHMVTDHLKQQALQHRRIEARGLRMKKSAIQRSKRAA